MTSSATLMHMGRFQDAIEQLRREAARDWQDDFKIGPAAELGAAMLCAGRYQQAQQHFDRLIESVPAGVSLHYLYSGMAFWFRRKWVDAIRRWEAGLGCGYFGYSGLDIPLALYYASVRRPAVYDASRAETLIVDAMQGQDLEYFPLLIGQFVTGMLDEIAFREAMSRVEGKNARAIRKSQLALVEFYIGLAKLRRGERRSFAEHMEQCASTRMDDLYHEWVLARNEGRSRSARRSR